MRQRLYKAIAWDAAKPSWVTMGDEFKAATREDAYAESERRAKEAGLEYHTIHEVMEFGVDDREYGGF